MLDKIVFHSEDKNELEKRYNELAELGYKKHLYSPRDYPYLIIYLNEKRLAGNTMYLNSIPTYTDWNQVLSTLGVSTTMKFCVNTHCKEIFDIVVAKAKAAGYDWGVGNVEYAKNRQYIYFNGFKEKGLTHCDVGGYSGIAIKTLDEVLEILTARKEYKGLEGIEVTFDSKQKHVYLQIDGKKCGIPEKTLDKLRMAKEALEELRIIGRYVPNLTSQSINVGCKTVSWEVFNEIVADYQKAKDL